MGEDDKSKATTDDVIGIFSCFNADSFVYSCDDGWPKIHDCEEKHEPKKGLNRGWIDSVLDLVQKRSERHGYAASISVMAEATAARISVVMRCKRWSDWMSSSLRLINSRVGSGMCVGSLAPNV